MTRTSSSTKHRHRHRHLRSPAGKAPLSHAEAALWLAWTRASESVSSGVAREVADATGLSAADHGVLSSLVELGQGVLRQQQLADAMHWQKSRLSHHLSRMERRKLVRREQAQTNVVRVVISAAGRRALLAARPVQALAIRARLIRKLSQPEGQKLLDLLTRLNAE